MLQTIQEALENFCVHQIRLPYTIVEGISKKRTLIAYIDINSEDSTKHRVYIASDEEFMQKISFLFLEEEKSDEETLVDMTLETANLIIGSAKVIAEEANKNKYTIETPHFKKFELFDYEFDDAKTIVVDTSELTIAIKELDV